MEREGAGSPDTPYRHTCGKYVANGVSVQLLSAAKVAAIAIRFKTYDTLLDLNGIQSTPNVMSNFDISLGHSLIVEKVFDWCGIVV
ncbi:Trypsin zeta [Dirofilaria immitis]